MTDQPSPRTRWRLPRARVSVRALMGVVLVLAVGLGFYVRSVHVQQDAVAAIKRAGGSVQYDRRWGDHDPDIYPHLGGKWRAPMWLARLVPVDYVANIAGVHLNPRGYHRNKVDDETLAHLGRLGHLEGLSLSGTGITDAGMAHLKGLTRLEHLSIDRTMVGDVGLAYLKGLTSLRSVSISGNRISDEGRLDLERALPNVWISHQDEMVSSDIRQRARDGLDFARSRPVRQASALLVDRSRFMITRRDTPEVIATVDALCDLEAGDKLSLIKLAEGRAECIGLLQASQPPDIPAAERERLLRRCADRGIDALTRAVELGYDNVRRLEGNLGEAIMLGNLHNHPAFPKLIEAMKAKRQVP
jgi:Leucine Rich repeat